MVTQRLERMVAQVRRWRSGSETDPLPVSPALSDGDLKRLRRLIDECVSNRGGEIAARRRATAIGATFLSLDEEGRENFFRLLADEYDHDDDEVDHAIDDVLRARTADERRIAERALAQTLRPKRERLLRRFVNLDGGLHFLVDLREELLAHRSTDGALSALDEDLRRILEGWFDIALLRLERLTWDTPASLLEKLIEYEAVHAIESWDDLQGRLGQGRRCYAFLHPMMPGEPLIFVEVALTRGMADDLPRLLDHDSSRPSAADADTAIFYSISNCHPGLAGVSLGDSLIKHVVEELEDSIPTIEHFATLSPIPGFRSWLLAALADEDGSGLMTEGERQAMSPEDAEAATQRLHDLVAAASPPPNEDLDVWKPVLMRLAARYLAEERRGHRALDAVAHFHLSNGARIEQLNWRANPGQVGWDRGLGMMVNYSYVLKHIESNHDGYVGDGTVETSEAIDKLLVPTTGSRIRGA